MKIDFDILLSKEAEFDKNAGIWGSAWGGVKRVGSRLLGRATHIPPEYLQTIRRQRVLNRQIQSLNAAISAGTRQNIPIHNLLTQRAGHTFEFNELEHLLRGEGPHYLTPKTEIATGAAGNRLGWIGKHPLLTTGGITGTGYGAYRGYNWLNRASNPATYAKKFLYNPWVWGGGALGLILLSALMNRR